MAMHRSEAKTLDEILTWQKMHAEAQAAAARMVLGWHLDALRLKVGLVRVVGKHEAPDQERPARMIPTGRDEHGQNWCLLVKDVV